MVLIKKNIYKFILALSLVFIYLPWLDLFKSLSGGDWPYLYKENILSFKVFMDPPFLWLEPYYHLTSKIGQQLFSIPWEMSEKIFWFYPFLIIGAFSSWIFIKELFSKLGIIKFKGSLLVLGCLLFMANTYVLMIVGGGQMGVGLAYSLSPLVLYSFLRIFDVKEISIKNLIVLSLSWVLQLMFDPRLFLVTLSFGALYALFLIAEKGKSTFLHIKNLFFVGTIALIGNLFWIIPNFGFFQSKYTEAAVAANVSFLSFATFPNSIAMLHPNWPDNIFGKIGFMKPEFLGISLLVYSSVLFINLENKNQKLILVFLNIVGLLGAFFSKGVNEPFGQIYLFLSNIPGGSLFRDPTKFYLWIVLSYSVLIPFTVSNFISLIERTKRVKKYSFFAVFILVFVYFAFLMSPILKRDLKGTFNPQQVPVEYMNFKNFIISQKGLSYILWFPVRQQFGFSSYNHPFLNAQELIPQSTSSGLIGEFRKKETERLVKDNDVKYVVIPYDSKKEIFLEDGKYSENIYKKDIDVLSKITWLKKLDDKESKFGKIVIFEVK